MSYVHLDDEHEGGQLSQFRARLSAEVRMQTGEDFPIFQDRNDIAWGQNWRSRIEETLDSTTLLIPIITPSFFRSPACCEEVSRFLERERRLNRTDLILPVYYISAPELDDPTQREADPLARVLAERQFGDWRELRFEPFSAPAVRRALANLAGRLRDSFWRVETSGEPASRLGVAVAPRGRKASDGGEAEAGGPAGAGRRPVVKKEPPTHVVDPFHRGDFATIGAAIEAASPGDRILVRPGLYEDALVIDKPLELLGDGDVSDIVIQVANGTALMFRANIGRVANLTIRNFGEEPPGSESTSSRDGSSSRAATSRAAAGPASPYAAARTLACAGITSTTALGVA
ncbi:toll/interleukin-1 receptor domain-containing protein [Blastococcus sp. PRF04-17]|uniref:toll/interleukin-1 receptor domain-containing protein n=1 Tax=Blastococcus sp. PRF04-17 TaxID=2933797 RepID=UPI001FF5A5A1|nr:toll/interleukin-1 receptor domain-containing protein [Blastococcus sp. PRF04-17]UOY01522.1 TIR domain-containing protein [Blastococcus sp. PRF04-17]